MSGPASDEVSGFELRASSFELRASSFELRASSFELRASSFELRASSFELGSEPALLLELLADPRQLLAPLGRRLGVVQVEAVEGLEDDLRDDQPGVLLVVGGDHEPRRGLGA